jgi:hypothetical protein
MQTQVMPAPVPVPAQDKGENVEMYDTTTLSSSLANIGYHPTTQVMFVRFKSNLSILYAYRDVSAAHWEDFKEAPSKGAWIARNLVAHSTTTATATATPSEKERLVAKIPVAPTLPGVEVLAEVLTIWVKQPGLLQNLNLNLNNAGILPVLG